MDDVTLDRLAELLVGFGANVQAGQIVALQSEIGKEELTRRVAAAAYRRGALFVDVSYFDPWVKRARIQHADPDTLDFVPPWYGERIDELGRRRGARIALAGAVAPGLMSDLDPALAGRDQLPRVKESIRVVSERTTNWTIGPAPNPGWAAVVYPDRTPEEALRALWDDMITVLRLDEPDPVAAWTERQDQLVAVAERLTERRFDALRFRGPGTDLTIGLMASSRWITARFETVEGLRHAPNLPSEEVFTTPDPERVDGHVRSTRPLLVADTLVQDLEVRFEAGRAVDIDAREGAGALRATADRDEGGRRLGEVALVDRHGRVGPLGRIFYDTLLDENAASHIALGAAYEFAVSDEADARRANKSQIHVDFMIGSPEMEVDGLAADGSATAVLRDGDWQI